MSARLLAMALALMGCAPLDVITPPADAGVSDATAPTPDASAPLTPPGQVGGGFCDQQDDCDTCRACSAAPFEQCNRLALSCEALPECLALSECLSDCTGDACVRACVAAHPSGREPLLDVALCQICDACPRDCAEHTSSCEGEAPF